MARIPRSTPARRSGRTRTLAVTAALATALSMGIGVAPNAVAANRFNDQSPIGVDVSRWQHPGTPSTHGINWGKVAAAGKDFAFIKATDPTQGLSPHFQRDSEEAAKNGLVIGAYHKAHPDRDAARQADEFIAALALQPDDATTLPPVLDLELTNGMSPAAVEQWAQTFLERVESATGRKPMIYTFRWFWESEMKNSRKFKDYPLWFAAYQPTAPESLPGGWEEMTFWQNSATGRVNGIVTPVDLDTFNGSEDELLALAREGAGAGSGSGFGSGSGDGDARADGQGAANGPAGSSDGSSEPSDKKAKDGAGSSVPSARTTPSAAPSTTTTSPSTTTTSPAPRTSARPTTTATAEPTTTSPAPTTSARPTTTSPSPSTAESGASEAPTTASTAPTITSAAPEAPAAPSDDADGDGKGNGTVDGSPIVHDQLIDAIIAAITGTGSFEGHGIGDAGLTDDQIAFILALIDLLLPGTPAAVSGSSDDGSPDDGPGTPRTAHLELTPEQRTAAKSDPRLRSLVEVLRAMSDSSADVTYSDLVAAIIGAQR